MTKRPTRVRALKIEELSIVDHPANKGSRVILAKREDGMFKPCADCKSVEKCTEMQKCSGSMEKADAGFTALLRRVAKKLGIDPNHPDESSSDSPEESVNKKDYSKLSADELRAELAKRDGAAPDNSAVVERLEKMEKRLSDLTESLKKAETAAATHAETVTKLREEARERHFTTIAKSMSGNALVDANDVSAILKQVDEKGSTALQNILKRFSGVVEEAELFEPVGKRGSEAGEIDAHTKIHKRAIEIQKGDGNLSYSQAVTQAMEEDPDAYEASLNENLG